MKAQSVNAKKCNGSPATAPYQSNANKHPWNCIHVPPHGNCEVRGVSWLVPRQLPWIFIALP